MSQLAFTLPGLDSGRRSERVEYGIRALEDGGGMRRGQIQECGEHTAQWATAPETAPERSFHGWPRQIELVSRTVVTYTSAWESA